MLCSQGYWAEQGKLPQSEEKPITITARARSKWLWALLPPVLMTVEPPEKFQRQWPQK